MDMVQDDEDWSGDEWLDEDEALELARWRDENANMLHAEVEEQSDIDIERWNHGDVAAAEPEEIAPVAERAPFAFNPPPQPEPQLPPQAQQPNEAGEGAAPAEEPVLFGRIHPKDRHKWYMQGFGANYTILEGKEVPKESHGANRATAAVDTIDNIGYVERLYGAPIELSFSRRRCERVYQYGAHFHAPENAAGRGETAAREWTVWIGAESLSDVSVLDIQSSICAALNSRVRLRWSCGVAANGAVTGCAINQSERDALRASIDYCTAREFVPPLDPDYVRLSFIPVRGAPCNEQRYVMEIRVTQLPETMYQLSSGRIFYENNGVVSLASGMDCVRRLLTRSASERQWLPELHLSKKGVERRRRAGLALGVGAAALGCVALGWWIARRNKN